MVLLCSLMRCFNFLVVFSYVCQSTFTAKHIDEVRAGTCDYALDGELFTCVGMGEGVSLGCVDTLGTVSTAIVPMWNGLESSLCQSCVRPLDISVDQ